MNTSSYSVDSAAATLQTTPLNVALLVAIGEIDATVAGGNTLVTPAAVDQYIRGGAKKFEPAAALKDGGWFVAPMGRKGEDYQRDKFVAEMLPGKLMELLDEYAEAQTEPGPRVDSVAVTPTAAMKAVANSKPPTPLGSKQRETPYTFLELWSLFQLRRSALDTAKTLNKLYANRQAFTEHVAKAIANVGGLTVKVTRHWPSSNINLRPDPHSVRFYLRIADLFGASAGSKLLKLSDDAF